MKWIFRENSDQKLLTRPVKLCIIKLNVLLLWEGDDI